MPRSFLITNARYRPERTDPSSHDSSTRPPTAPQHPRLDLAPPQRTSPCTSGGAEAVCERGTVGAPPIGMSDRHVAAMGDCLTAGMTSYTSTALAASDVRDTTATTKNDVKGEKHVSMNDLEIENAQIAVINNNIDAVITSKSVTDHDVNSEASAAISNDVIEAKELMTCVGTRRQGGGGDDCSLNDSGLGDGVESGPEDVCVRSPDQLNDRCIPQPRDFAPNLPLVTCSTKRFTPDTCYPPIEGVVSPPWMPPGRFPFPFGQGMPLPLTIAHYAAPLGLGRRSFPLYHDVFESVDSTAPLRDDSVGRYHSAPARMTSEKTRDCDAVMRMRQEMNRIHGARRCFGRDVQGLNSEEEINRGDCNIDCKLSSYPAVRTDDRRLEPTRIDVEFGAAHRIRNESNDDSAARRMREEFGDLFSSSKERYYRLDHNLNELIERTTTAPPWRMDDESMSDAHVCVDCGKRYSTSSNLARHRQSHRGGATQQRHSLNFLPLDATSSQSHHHSEADSKARKCPHCEKAYTSLPAYSMHVRTHNEGCACPHCGKRFSRPWLLQGHVRTHTGEKPFSCAACGKHFADKSNLRAHVQTHSPDKPFVCGRCGKAFALKSYLYKHEESSCMRGAGVGGGAGGLVGTTGGLGGVIQRH